MSLPALQDALKTVKYPGFSRDIVSFGLVRSLDLQDGRAIVKLAVTTADLTVPKQLKAAVESAVRQVPEVRDAIVEIAVTAPKAQAPAQPAAPAGMPGVRYTVAVASGKGGVGKSTFAVNLACALAGMNGGGLRVGLMDCDIYGPSVPLMMGLHGRPEIADDSLVPLQRHGIKVMSMGFLVDNDTPVVWRGPMVMKTIQQFVQNVVWGELDVLVVDLPPGTGDAQLSLVQTIPLSGAVLVTTPQTAATQVARRGGLMFEKVNVPLIGVVENMSYLELEDGTRSHIFGQGGGAKTAEQLHTALLGEIPLVAEVRAGGDAGEPVVVAQPASRAAQAFATIGERIMQILQHSER